MLVQVLYYEMEQHLVHGATTDGAQLISCGAAAASAPVFSYEVINKLTGDECSDTWVANGDYGLALELLEMELLKSLLLKSTDVRLQQLVQMPQKFFGLQR